MRKTIAASGFILAATIAGFASDANAVGSAPFLVTATLKTDGANPTESKTGFCIKTPEPRDFGATVTVVCKTGEQVDLFAPATGMPYLPTHGGAYRYLVQVSSGGEMLGTIDAYAGVGTTTSWRVVSLGDYDYLEMLLGW